MRENQLLSSKDIAKSRPRVNQEWLFNLVIIVLCSTHILLPLERTAGYIYIGIPILISVIINFGCFLLLLLSSQGKMVFLDGFVLWGLLLFCLQLMSLLVTSTDLNTQLQIALRYFGTFILNYFSVTFLFRQGYRERFIKCYVLFIVLCSILTILEGLFGFYLPPYESAYLARNYHIITEAATSISSGARAIGTLGNPLVSSIALSFSIPFVLEVRQPILRNSALVLVFAAVFFTYSRTSVIVVLILLFGVLIQRKVGRRILVFILLFTSSLLFVFDISSFELPQNIESILAPLIRDNSNILARQEYAQGTIAVFSKSQDISFLMGNGINSASAIGANIAKDQLGVNFVVQTIDNNWLTVLYEYGYLGLIVLVVFQLNLLFINRAAVGKDPHWYNLLTYVLIGFSFVTIYYSSINLPIIASFATLTWQSSQKILKQI